MGNMDDFSISPKRNFQINTSRFLSGFSPADLHNASENQLSCCDASLPRVQHREIAAGGALLKGHRAWLLRADISRRHNSREFRSVWSRRKIPKERFVF